MNVGQRMKERRKELKLSADKVAEKIGVDRSTIFRYEKGEIEKLPLEILNPLSEVLKTTPQHLMGWTDINTVQTIEIPVLGEIACGDPILAEENILEKHSRIASDLPNGNLFYLRAKGNSMFPDIKSGALVLCRQQPDVENGEVAAVLVNGNTEATLKKIRKTDDEFILEPINKEYESYSVNENNLATIIGKAIEVTNQL